MRADWQPLRSLLIAILLVFGCTDQQPASGSRVETLPFYDSSEFTPRWLRPEDVPPDFHRIPAFSLINQSSEGVSEVDMDGAVSVVDFFFTTCSGICPKLTDNMAMVQAAFDSVPDLLILSHSVTPEKDTVEMLRSYALRRGITSKRWHLLTGARSDIYALAREAYFADEDMGKPSGPDDFLHTESFLLVDRARHLRGIYNGLDKGSVQQLIVDARTLIAEPALQ